ncbi:MAG: FCD domain-containing protein [Paracoccus sp. (in: a-proteobacteria)]|nr:FCD domain-containing protein [Paracoccus sp. (in: a-proteobacteria)]
MNKIKSENNGIGDGAHRRIRTDIIFGRLAPGQRLRLESLRDSYEVSVSTLREILSRLASEGLVTAEGQRGFQVSTISEHNLREIAALRLLLESHAMAHSFETGGVEWEASVLASHHKLATMERRMSAGDLSQTETWKRYDWEFHQSLIAACGSEMLMQTHAQVFDKYLRYQMIALSHRGEIAAAEHLELKDCALRRDAARARDVLIAHVEGGVSHALETGLLAGFMGDA